MAKLPIIKMDTVQKWRAGWVRVINTDEVATSGCPQRPSGLANVCFWQRSKETKAGKAFAGEVSYW